VIAISLAVVVVVCAVGFGLTLGADLDHRDQELTIGEILHIHSIQICIHRFICNICMY
jgi:hypothetical protein